LKLLLLFFFFWGVGGDWHKNMDLCHKHSLFSFLFFPQNTKDDG